MDPRWLALPLALLAGCSPAPRIEVTNEPPVKTDTNFANLPRILAAIPKSAEVKLYRGLPSEFWEPELRTQELKRAKTIKLHGYAFYEEPIPIPEVDAGRLTALLSSKTTFRRHNGKNRCGGYSPEYGIEWKAGGDGTRALVCMECAEIKLFATKYELYCDLNPDAKPSLEALLDRRKQDRTSATSSP